MVTVQASTVVTTTTATIRDDVDTPTSGNTNADLIKIIEREFGSGYFNVGAGGGNDQLPPASVSFGAALDELEGFANDMLNLLDGSAAEGEEGTVNFAPLASAMLKVAIALREATRADQADRTQDQIRDQVRSANKQRDAAKEIMKGALTSLITGLAGGMATIGIGSWGAHQGVKSAGFAGHTAQHAALRGSAEKWTSAGHAMQGQQYIGGFISANAEQAAAEDRRHGGLAQADATKEEAQGQRLSDFSAGMRELVQAMLSAIREWRESNNESVRKIIN